jgi:hypothetical protein
MIRASKEAGRAITLGNLGASMSTHIEESTQFGVLSACDQNGYTHIVVRAKGTGRRPIGDEAYEKRMPPEQDLLAGSALRIGVNEHTSLNQGVWARAVVFVSTKCNNRFNKAI